MKYVADLHIHSSYSRATSKKCDLPHLFAWGRMKGIHLIGTGDFTHPRWLAHLKEHLEPAEPGLFKLKKESIPEDLEMVSPEDIPTRFVLTGEISSIYKRHDKVRKVHNVLLLPDFESVERVNTKLAGIGNLEADGRPILGLDSRDLLEIQLEEAPEGFLIPAHIWTPWFALFGSKSGFDSVEACFGDLTEHIFALETGLSSDPEMNRLISALDRYTLVSNSDAHSPQKLGREANLFDTDFDFFAMREALKHPSTGDFQGTIEFYPEEGKYHLDGHRKCNVSMEPEETRKHKNICPECGKALTVGTLHRVMELADRSEPQYPHGSPPFHSLVPLPEVLGEIVGTSPNSKKVWAEYVKVLNAFGSEFNILRHTPLEDLRKRHSPALSEAVNRIRTGNVIRQAGYDGEYGVIRVFDEQADADLFSGQSSFFGDLRKPLKRAKKKRSSFEEGSPTSASQKGAGENASENGVSVAKRELNSEQRAAVVSHAKQILVSAGPGTGKTFTLVSRVKHLLTEGNLPQNMVVITFTNKAADEVRERIALSLQAEGGVDTLFVGTFHQFCLTWLRKTQPDLVVIGKDARELLLRNRFPEMPSSERTTLAQEIVEHFHQVGLGATTDLAQLSPEFRAYLEELDQHNGIELDAVIPFFVHQLRDDAVLREAVGHQVKHLSVDEFQDVNASQYELIRLLGETAAVFAIGDANQSIYGFRGSDLHFFHQMADAPSTLRLHLTQNYRSSASILEAATAVICHNLQRELPLLHPHNLQNQPLGVFQAKTPQGEAEFIANRIEELVGGTNSLSIHEGNHDGDAHPYSFEEIAILYRLSDQATALAEALEQRGIPYQRIGAKPFFMQSTLRIAYDWVRSAADVGAPEHLSLLSRLKGIGAQTISRLEREMPLQCSHFFEQAKTLDLSTSVQDKLREVQTQLERFQSQVTAEGLAPALQAISSFLVLDTDEDKVQRFLELSELFGKNLEAFAYHLEQNAAATIYDERANAVALMTLHAAKGLEFPFVFLTGVEEGMLPCQIPGWNYDMEEERRLFYVGLTRAQNSVILTSSQQRTRFGQTTSQQPSRFLAEIPPHLLSSIQLTPKISKQRDSGVQLAFF